ncbi:MAG: hypothetical protein IJD77_01570 [Clostridia bacterium]|nr:hypothetical protein [Clostridia bacterium]
MKKSSFFKIVVSLIMGLCFAFCYGCGGGNQAGTQSEQPSFQLTLDKSEVILSPGETITLVASIGASSYSWTVENPQIVEFSPNGNICEIHSRRDGTTKVIVTADNQKSECIVHASIDNLERVASLLSFSVLNMDESMGKAQVSAFETGVRTYITFDEDSVVIAEITFLPKNSFQAGTLNSIDIRVSFDLTSSIPLAQQILNSSNINIIYYYPGPQAGLLGFESFKMLDLIYSIDNEYKVVVTDGNMSNTSHLLSLSPTYSVAIMQETLNLLSEGMTDFIKGINEECNINICK